MEGLTAKVFRTYNASITLQQQLKELTNRKSCPLKLLGEHVLPCNTDRASLAEPQVVYLFTTSLLQFL